MNIYYGPLSIHLFVTQCCSIKTYENVQLFSSTYYIVLYMKTAISRVTQVPLKNGRKTKLMLMLASHENLLSSIG